MEKPLLKISGLQKSFNGIEVLHSVNLQVRAGEIVALVGGKWGWKVHTYEDSYGGVF